MFKKSLFEEDEEVPDNGRAVKRVKLLSNAEASNGTSSHSLKGGEHERIGEFSINQEYARRFEHNSKRAELHRLEEKYGRTKSEATEGRDEQGSEDDETSSASEEDDDGGLASGTLEADFNATLQAIKNKDPRIYKQEEKFYKSDEEPEDDASTKKKTEKPMFLIDYHRQNLLNGSSANNGESVKPSYDQQQNNLRESLVKEIHNVEAESDDEKSDQDGLFKVKRRPTPPIQEKPLSSKDIEQADHDPEEFLSKFLQARAWTTNSAVDTHVFESDDEEEDRKADEFEEAYNLRFENVNGLNEKLVSHARDTAAKYSVRDDAKSQRQRARNMEREKKEDARSERVREKAQLKKLRMEEMGRKLDKIKEAAGGQNTSIVLEEWFEFLTEDWDDGKWEAQMQSRFDANYYAEPDAKPGEDEQTRTKTSKPKWDDDIDIGDIVPDFAEDDTEHFSLSEEDEAPLVNGKHKKAANEEEKRAARRQKRKLEQLAEEKVDLDLIMAQSVNKDTKKFRYRETSPVSWGLSPRDILMASDTQLNQFAGLKKLASFREAEKRKKDKKKLGKKARLRQWRKDTFGDVEGPKQTIQDLIRESQPDGSNVEAHESRGLPDTPVNGTGKRKRSRKTKDQDAAELL